MNRLICLLVAVAFTFTSCSTICRKPTETVMITSDPPGAKVIVDGNELGVTPSYVQLDPKKSHRVLLEKDGWCSQQYTIKSRISKAKLGSNVFLPVAGLVAGGAAGLCVTGGATSGMAPLAIFPCMAIGVVVGVTALIVGSGVDLYTGNARKLDSKVLNVQLVPLKLDSAH